MACPSPLCLRFVASVASVALLTATSPAHADDVAAPDEVAAAPVVARMTLEMQGTEGAVLEQRVLPAGSWLTVCTLPCEAVVIQAPHAEHRLIAHGDEEHPLPLVVRGQDGERVQVKAKVGSRRAKRDFHIATIAVGATAVVLAGIGAGLVVGNMRWWSTDADCSSCSPGEKAAREKSEDARGAGGALMAVGLVTGLGAVALLLVGSELGRSSVRVASPPATVAQRRPEWSAPRPPPLPPTHAQLLDLAF